jgi:hypothetical protein
MLSKGSIILQMAGAVILGKAGLLGNAALGSLAGVGTSL